MGRRGVSLSAAGEEKLFSCSEGYCESRLQSRARNPEQGFVAGFGFLSSEVMER